MWNSSDLNGLDQTLSDLQNAINSLSDGPVKNRLIKSFRKLQNVRREINGSKKLQHDDSFNILMVFSGIFLLSLVFYFLFKKTSEF